MYFIFYLTLTCLGEIVYSQVQENATIVPIELSRSQMVDGRYINSFNLQYKLPSFGKIIWWKITAKDNTRLPSDRKALDTLLPVIRHEKPEELYLNKSGIRFIWIGHASCYIQMNNFRFLVDPVFSDRCGPRSSLGPKRFRPPALTANDLPNDLDAVFISHNHYDHLDYSSVMQLNERYGKRLTWFCGRGLREWFLDEGISNVIELDWWEEYYFSVRKYTNTSTEICKLCSLAKRCEYCILSCSTLVIRLYLNQWKIFIFVLYNFRSRRTPFDRNKSLWGGFAIWDATHKFYFAGDTGYTNNIPIFRQIGQKYGPFDLSAIPIGAYEPRWVMQEQHVSPTEAVRIHMEVQSNKSIGIHWGTWAMAYEYFLEPPEKLAEAVENNDLESSSFIVVKHGEVFDLP